MRILTNRIYAALSKVLKVYVDLLTKYRAGKAEPGAVTVVVSGNRDREAITKQKVRYSAVDGRPEERGAEAPAGLVPWVSASWGTLFTWAEARPRPAAERARRNGVRRQGAPGGPAVRYWATPE